MWKKWMRLGLEDKRVEESVILSQTSVSFEQKKVLHMKGIPSIKRAAM